MAERDLACLDDGPLDHFSHHGLKQDGGKDLNKLIQEGTLLQGSPLTQIHLSNGESETKMKADASVFCYLSYLKLWSLIFPQSPSSMIVAYCPLR
jgi:hypothetical protein